MFDNSIFISLLIEMPTLTNQTLFWVLILWGTILYSAHAHTSYNNPAKVKHLPRRYYSQTKKERNWIQMFMVVNFHFHLIYLTQLDSNQQLSDLRLNITIWMKKSSYSEIHNKFSVFIMIIIFLSQSLPSIKVNSN